MNDTAAPTLRPSQRVFVAPEIVARAMRSVWTLTIATHVYGLTTGLVNASAPHAANSLGFTSLQVGLVGAGVPTGYATGCLLSGWLLNGIRARRVLLGGVLGAALALSSMCVSRSPSALILAQVCYGIFSGAVWPFFSAWLLDFTHAGVPRTRVLRMYNMAWTSGTAVGMLSGGQFCAAHWTFRSFAIGAGLIAAVATLLLLVRDAPHLTDDDDDAPRPVPSTVVVTRAALLAAASFNLIAIGVKLLLNVTYVQLNALQHGGPERMGYFMAGTILVQLVAFAGGRWYESYLGCRRVYALGGLALCGTMLAFATVNSTWILLPAAGLAGLVLAVAFQGSILAFTARSRTPRAGTTLSEALIGMAGFTPIAAGFFIDTLRAHGVADGTALRAPFYAWMGLIALALVAQVVWVTSSKESRRLAGTPR